MEKLLQGKDLEGFRTLLFAATGIILLIFLFFPLSSWISITGNSVAEFFPVSSSFLRESSLPSFLQDSGTLEVYFCPRDLCEEHLLGFLVQARVSIHCAFYNLNLDAVRKKLEQKAEEESSAVEVQLVFDDSSSQQVSSSAFATRSDDSSALMHNKFCVVDGKKVLTGSMNPTAADAQKNFNNLLIIDAPLLAQNYEEEFQELWQGEFHGGEKTLNSHLRIGDVALENYFCPEDNCAARVLEELQKAERSIYFMVFSFTHQGIAHELLLQRQEMVQIQGIMDQQQAAQQHSVFPLLQYQGVDVLKEDFPVSLHHKVFIVDEKTVITSSFNPTKSGDSRNDENLLIIHDSEIAHLFLAEFHGLWKELHGTENQKI